MSVEFRHDAQAGDQAVLRSGAAVVMPVFRGVISVDWMLYCESKYRVRDAAGRRVAEGRTKREAVVRALAAAKRQGVSVRVLDGDWHRIREAVAQHAIPVVDENGDTVYERPA